MPGKTDLKRADRAAEAVARRPADDGSSLADRIYRILSEQIASGELPQGGRLRETEIAAQFDISRTPAREALKKLQAEGLAVETPTGLSVVKPSLTEILDDYMTREVLEGLAARFAGERILEPELMLMRTLLKRADKAHEEGDVDAVETISDAFDNVIFEAARSPRLKRTIEGMRTGQGVARRGNLQNQLRRAASLRERGEMLAAIGARDPKAAELATREHLAAAREYYLNAVLAAE